MIVVGLTGRIGAGKSTVAGLFADRGAAVVDADRVAHDVLREPEVARLVAERFGPGVFDADAAVDRKKLANRVFGPTAAHARDLEALEAIVHPRVAARIEARLDEMAARPRADDSDIVILDVPLLSKSGLLGRCTHLLEVVCDEPVRRARLAARGWTPAEIEARDAAWDRSGPLARGLQSGEEGPAAGFLDASGDVRYTSQQVDRVLRDFAASRRNRGT